MYHQSRARGNPHVDGCNAAIVFSVQPTAYIYIYIYLNLSSYPPISNGCHPHRLSTIHYPFQRNNGTTNTQTNKQTCHAGFIDCRLSCRLWWLTSQAERPSTQCSSTLRRSTRLSPHSARSSPASPQRRWRSVAPRSGPQLRPSRITWPSSPQQARRLHLLHTARGTCQCSSGEKLQQRGYL